MDKVYWYLEYVKVLLGYIIFLYVWPSVVYRKYLKGKGIFFRCMFCPTVQIVLANTVILGLGIVHLLNKWIVVGLFYGIFIISLVRGENRKNQLMKLLLAGKCGVKIFIVRIFEKPIEIVKGIWNRFKKNLVEYILLAIILVFGMIFFSYGAFQDYSYACNDQYTHHSWIYALKQGEVFAKGIYPEAMHCFIYSLHTVFGLRIYSCILFLGGIHIFTFLIAAYYFMRKLFQWKYTSLFVLIAYLTFNSSIQDSGAIWGMARLQWAIPQEFGLFLVFQCPASLICFFQEGNNDLTVKYWFKNKHLLLLMLGVGAAVSTHFYVLIMAFIICLAVVIIHLKAFFNKRNIKILLQAIFYGIEIGATPMLIAYIMGKDLEGSLRWGIRTIRGESTNSVKAQMGEAATIIDGNVLKIVCEKYVSLFGEKIALGIIAICLLLIGLLFFYTIFSHKEKKSKYKSILSRRGFAGYFYAIFALFFFILLYIAPYIGLPEIVSVARMFSTMQMLLWETLMIPIDLFLFMTASELDKKVIRLETILSCVIVYCSAFLIDFHEFLYCSLGRYNATVSVTNEIISLFPQNSYTIVSTGVELYQMMEDGRHEEILDFTQKIDEKEYYIPTEYIFLYVEKHPILYEQTHYYVGNKWLAQRNQSVNVGSENMSECPEILCSEISLGVIEDNIPLLPEPYDNYENLDIRTMLFSKVYSWYQDFNRYYPVETNVYYEDEDFICYVIHQNPYSLLNLSLNDD